MNLITVYAPSTFLMPCIVISTVFTDDLKETAVAFVEALNGNHALNAIYSGDKTVKRSEFIPVEKHKSLKSAATFHTGLATKMQNGRSEEIWEAGRKPYLKLYDEHCPTELKNNL